jgi:hypothetical protein
MMRAVLPLPRALRGCITSAAALGVALLGALVACGAPHARGVASAPAPVGPTARDPRVAPDPRRALLSPARYLLTDRLGAVFDEEGEAAEAPRPEPAIVDGVRVIVEGGVVRGAARSAERLVGFRSVAARLGGGFVIWSDARTYRAGSFLGDLEPIVDVGATGGVRPFLDGLLLRTSVGVIAVDPASLEARRLTVPGLAEAFAVDALRAARVDALGRASVTTDGGATWTDVLAAKGVTITGLGAGEGGDLLLTGPHGGLTIRHGSAGALEPPSAAPPRGLERSDVRWLNGAPASSRSLAGQGVAHAAFAGALLPRGLSRAGGARAPASGLPGEGRVLVAREGGMSVIGAATGLPVADVDLVGVNEKFGRCQPIALPGEETALAVCAQDDGGEVLDLREGIGRARLEVTFPAPGIFIAGPGGRLGFTGPCGPLPARGFDRGPGEPRPDSAGDEDTPTASATVTAPPDPSSRGEALADDDARLCVRLAGGDRWIERRLRGAASRGFYRWVLGDDGEASALIVRAKVGGPAEGSAPKSPGPVASVGEGVRIITLDPADPALQGGAYPAVMAAQKDLPYRAIDEDFWQDDDGAIRGWALLPAAGEGDAGPEDRAPPRGVEARRGGRAAGVRVDRAGTVTLFPPPVGAREVLYGGRFGFAVAEAEGSDRYFETTDGGRSWTPVEGPPVGTLDAAFDDSTPARCSAVGCAFPSGVVRLGWSGPSARGEPSAPSTPEFTPAANPLIRGPSPLVVSCRLDAAFAPWSRVPGSEDEASHLRAGRAAPPKEPARAGGAPGRAHPGDTFGPPPPISLRFSGASPVGALDGHTWSGEVSLPFAPTAAPRRLSVNEPALNAAVGSVVPVLERAPRAGMGEQARRAGGVDLLLVVDHRRLRAGAGSAFLPFAVPSALTIAAEAPGGTLVVLDADKGVVWASRGEATSAALRLTRVPDVARSRLTLARRLDRDGLALVGYSTSTGEVFAGDLDLARAEVGPLVALGAVSSILEADSGACRGRQASHRLLAEIPAIITVFGPDARRLFSGAAVAALLLEGDGERLCARGIEASLERTRATELSAVFGKFSRARVRGEGVATLGSCSIEGGK